MMFITDPDSLETDCAYNTNGWTTAVTNKVDTTPANNIVVQYGYDDNGARTSETDPLSNAWAREYDAMGRCTKITEPGAASPAKTVLRYFDGNDNVVKVTDFNKRATLI
jgi:YD repeat-containing protein